MMHQAGSAAEPARNARWYSFGLEQLIERIGHRDGDQEPAAPDFDVVIVGSGYGGAIAAAELSGCVDAAGREITVCVLERGREYLAGMFPSSEADLAGHVRVSPADRGAPRGKLTGLFDLRLGPDVSALVANGLGGGSLINAGVMARAAADVLDSPRWPSGLRKDGVFDHYYGQAERQLKPSLDGASMARIDASGAPLPEKFSALRAFAGARKFQPAPLSIALEPSVNSANVNVSACIRCGDCATGCNQRAKNSLDQNRLYEAHRRGAEIYTGATVLDVRKRQAEGWVLRVVHTDDGLRKRHGKALRLYARRLILAAGAFGSTEILLRSRSDEFRLPAALGRGFSTNGDMLAVSYGQQRRVNAVVDEHEPFAQRNTGPTITGIIDLRERSENRIVIEEFAIPGALRRLFEESFTLSHSLHRIAKFDWSVHSKDPRAIDSAAVDPEIIGNTQVFGIMGHDGASGELRLRNRSVDEACAHVHWPELRRPPQSRCFDDQVAELRHLNKEAGLGGTVLPNPVWQLFPPELQGLIDAGAGGAVTVHPLGGCRMAELPEDGVVNEYGQVFNPDSDGGVYDDLVVLDGSIIPCSLGINPALTIAAVCIRAVEHLRDHRWAWTKKEIELPCATIPRWRAPTPATKKPTKLVVLERLVGEVDLQIGGHSEPRVVELTLQFEPADIRALMISADRKLSVREGMLRTYVPQVWRQLSWEGAPEWKFEREAEVVATVSGDLRLLIPAFSRPLGRTSRGIWAWLLNRGMRDIWQLRDRRKRKPPMKRSERIKRLPGRLWRAVQGIVRLASHAGAVRRFDYSLKLEVVRRGAGVYSSSFVTGASIRGEKRLTYEWGANPWVQLQQVKLLQFPAWSSRGEAQLTLDQKFFAREQRHLLQIDQQRDHATSLFDIGSFLLYVLRVVLPVHAWSFRKPDAARPGPVQRLPGRIEGLPEPEITEIETDVSDRRRPVFVRLTRYRSRAAKAQPVALIHGFSANGTTFAHPALKPNLASFLWDRGRDVWVVDLRTSSGLESSRDPWAFEDVARGDIPAALDYIHRTTGQRVDVVAHCMGAVMLAMAIMDDPLAPPREENRHTKSQSFARRRRDIQKYVRRVVLSQVGPIVVFSPENIFRGYSVAYIQKALDKSVFEFRPPQNDSGHLLDRLLATLPYPAHEFQYENPRIPWRRTPFVGTRHRMDAWFGRVFNVGNVDRDVLEHIDDMFGPINVDTVLQTINFAKRGLITTREGKNAFVSDASLRRWKNIPTLSLHSDENGLADFATYVRTCKVMKEADVRDFRVRRLKGFGHQDALIGRRAPLVYARIERFLAKEDEKVTSKWHRMRFPQYLVDVPWLGPVLGPIGPAGMTVAVGENPKYGTPATAFIVPVRKEQETFLPVLDGMQQVKLEASGVEVSRMRQVTVTEVLTWHRVTIPASFAQEWRQFLVLLVYSQTPSTKAGDFHGFLLPSSAPNVSLMHLAEPASIKPAAIAFDALNVPGLKEKAAQDAAKAQKAQAVSYVSSTPSSEWTCGVVEMGSGRDSSETPVSFALGSCQYPAGPLDEDVAQASYRRLADCIDGKHAGQTCDPPQFLVLTGDQVYIDATAGLMDPTSHHARYEVPYERWLRTPAVRAVLRRIPMFALMDDHELRNDWEDGSKQADQVREARRVFLKHQRCANPTRLSMDPDRPLFCAEEIEGLPFFFTDTRTDRSPRRAGARGELMCQAQLEALKEWLRQHRNRSGPKFIVSPSILLPRRLLSSECNASGVLSDAWDGFPTLNDVLAFIAVESIPNVVFLSGDEHHSCVATATLRATGVSGDASPGHSTVIHSIHSSALYAPFAFANGCPADLAEHEEFSVSWRDTGDSREYRCNVATKFFPGDGFAVLTWNPETRTLRCWFSREPDAQRDPSEASFWIQIEDRAIESRSLAPVE